MTICQANVFHFSVLSSTTQRLATSNLRISEEWTCATLPLTVYTNFPWPDLPADSEPNQPPTPAHKAQAAIETAAQAVPDARAQFPGSSLADLYDPTL